jgi:hypothetical protein
MRTSFWIRTCLSFVLTLGASLGVLATDYTITKAEWRSGDSKLKVEGKGPRRSVVLVKDAQSGAPLGTATVDREERWRVILVNPPYVPCRVRAEFQGSGRTAERAVKNAPADCGPGTTVTLTSLAVTGPPEVPENSTAAFAATAVFSDGSTQDVTASASWTENSPYATVSAGLLSVGEVPSDQTASVSASFTSGGVTQSASASVLLRNLVTLTSLAVTGPPEVPENSTAAFAATAVFSDGSTQDVTASASWTESSPYATVSAGLLSVGEVPSDQTASVSASFTSGGVTQSASASVTLRDLPPMAGSHVGRFASYEGTQTCLQCHETEARAFHGSAHYQWQGDASEVDGLDSPVAGKLGGINDFCIYPDINWIGKLTNVDGVQVDGGCARCHAGLGAKPEPVATQAQLENIDCLLCHAPQYKRKVDLVNGQFRFVPDLSRMGVTLLQAAVDIRLPSKDTCLDCHTRAGGGDNFKRGDIEEAHRNATPALDIHMAPESAGGAGLSCLDCHVAAGHRIPGRGIDLRERDTPTVVACSTCHGTAPHESADINKHLKRVDCTSCHIPSFAKVAPTDTVRDWSLPGEVSPVTRLFEPHMAMASNVTPVYGFFNGRSRFYQFGSPAVPGANGKVLMAGPQGSVQEAGAKIVAMKRHEGRQPMDPATNRLLPLKIGIFFQTGDLDTAVQQGAAGVNWTYTGHTFAETERFMGLYHEVASSDQALSCATCHDQNRLDWANLGYTPVATRNGKPLCSSCHGAKSNPGFYSLHNKHVGDKKLNCSSCHTFSKAL